MVSIETWSFAMVSIRIATLIETLVETSDLAMSYCVFRDFSQIAIFSQEC